MPTENTLEEMRALINTHIDKWVTAGKYVLPDVEECLEFIAVEAAEALQAKLRLNPVYVRNNPKPATMRDVAVELFDTMKMCIVYERITKQTLLTPIYKWDEENWNKILRHIISMTASAMLYPCHADYFAINHLLGGVYRDCSVIIIKLGFAPLDLAREKLHEMDTKRELGEE